MLGKRQAGVGGSVTGGWVGRAYVADIGRFRGDIHPLRGGQIDLDTCHPIALYCLWSMV
jgi:hypothetical protein